MVTEQIRVALQNGSTDMGHPRLPLVSPFPDIVESKGDMIVSVQGCSRHDCPADPRLIPNPKE